MIVPLGCASFAIEVKSAMFGSFISEGIRLSADTYNLV
jgi:hypothetical protein